MTGKRSSQDIAPGAIASVHANVMPVRAWNQSLHGHGHAV